MPRQRGSPQPRGPPSPATSSSSIAAAAAAAAAAIAAALYLHNSRPPEPYPRIWIEDNFLSAAEADALVQASSAATGCWERVSAHQTTALLETCRELTSTPLFQRIDERVARALGVNSSHLEHGYVQRYTAEYATHQVHLDQGKGDIRPRRYASAIVYLDDQPFGSGHTVFPFADARYDRSAAWWLPPAPPISAAVARTRDAWEVVLRDALPSRFFYPRGRGDDVVRRLQEQCAAGRGIRPRKGRALFFLHADADGTETIRATHGGCDLLPGAPPKHALVQLATDAPVR